MDIQPAETKPKTKKPGKWLFIGGGVAVLLGLFVLYQKGSNSTAQTETVADSSDTADYGTTDASQPQVTNTDLSAFMSGTLQNINDYQENTTQILEDFMTKQNDKFSSLQTTVDNLDRREVNTTTTQVVRTTGVNGGGSNNSTTSVIDTMQKNSEAWKTASPTERTNLHNQNEQLASKIGLTYNPSTGTYHNPDGSKAY